MPVLFIKPNVDEAPSPKKIAFRFPIGTLERIDRPDVRRLLVKGHRLAGQRQLRF